MQPEITSKYDECYTMTDYIPEDENTHHSGGKKENRRGEEDEEEGDDYNMGGKKVRCQNQ